MSTAIIIEVPKVANLTLSDLREADQSILAKQLSSFAGHAAKIRICASRNKLSAEQREINAQAKAERKAIRKEAAAKKASIALEKAEERAKKAQEALSKLQAKAAPVKKPKKSTKSSK